MSMEAKKAVAIAKSWVADQFAGEGVQDIGLEEVRFSSGVWQITIGFSRRWERAASNLLADLRQQRTYKVITISDKTEEVIAMRNREAA